MKKSKTKLFAFLLCLVLVLSFGMLGLTACSDKPEGVQNGPLKVNKISIEMGRGTTINSAKYGQWSVADENIATIETTVGTAATGFRMCTVKGVSVGKTTVSITVSGKTYNVAVTVTERNVITISANGAPATGTLDLEEEKTLQLFASSNLGTKKFKWTSSNPSRATVSSSGKVTALFPGKTTITAAVDGDEATFASVEINITAKAGSTKYELLMAEEGGSKSWVEADNAFTGDPVTEDTFFMWRTNQSDQQKITFEKIPQYVDGTISFKYTSDWDPGKWYGMQVFYKNSKHEKYSIYRLTCKINVKEASIHDGKENLDKIKVTLNGYVIELNKGMNDVDLCYVYTAPLNESGTSSFDLQMGWEDPSNPNGWFVQNADVEISDVKWEEDEPIDLEAPSFTYANGKVTVSDPNEEGVACYRALFYDENGVQKGASTLQNGEDFNTNALEKGTYTVKIQAVGKHAHYRDSVVSETSTTVTVTKDASYTLTVRGSKGEAMGNPGRWAYWMQDWVTVSATHDGGVTTVEFGNNAGTFDALQLFYKNPLNVAGKQYKLSVDIELDGHDGGHINLNSFIRTLKKGVNHIEVVYTEGKDDTSFTLLIAKKHPDGGDINDGTIIVSNYTWVEYNDPPVALGDIEDAVLAGEDTKTITFTEVENAYYGYEVGFFKEGANEPTSTIKINASGDVLDYEGMRSGTYTVKVRALSDGRMYAAVGAWSNAAGTITYSNPDGDDAYQLETGDGAAATASRGTWLYWTEWASVDASYAKGNVRLSFSNNQGAWYNLQLWIDPVNFEMGKTYTVSFTIKVENALITDDGITGGETYKPEDHKADGATSFLITVANQEKEISVGEDVYTFTITKAGPIQFLFAVNPDTHQGGNTFNHISAGTVTISDPVIKEK